MARAPNDHGPASHRARVRFYAELNDFLPPERRQRSFVHAFEGNPAVKDAIESLGVPHTEVDVILVNGESVGFEYHLQDEDDVAVYPVFEALDVAPVQRLRPAPLRETRFVVDGHLGKLARALRLLGFDTAYDASARDAAIIEQSRAEERIILTRDRGLLKAKAVTHGYWVRANDARGQVAEVVQRLDLRDRLRPFTRCTVCNGLLERAEAADAAPEAPPRVRERVTEYSRCSSCGKLYWKGSHFERLEAFVRWVRDGHA